MDEASELAQEIGNNVELEEQDKQEDDGYTTYTVTFPKHQKKTVYRTLLELEKTGIHVEGENRELILERGAQGQPIQGLGAQFIISVEDSKKERMYGSSAI